MKNLVSIIAAALILATVPVLAATECQELCDPAFYQTATGDDVQHLIDDGADVNALGNDDKSPLHWAAGATSDAIAVLLKAGADATARDKWDRTPLHFVSVSGSPKSVALLLVAGADVNARSANDWTPLHGVAKFGAPESIEFLIAAGADASIKNEMGETPYDLAGSNQRMQDTDALKALKDAR